MRRNGWGRTTVSVVPLSLFWEVAAGAGARVGAVLGVTAVPSASDAARSFAASMIAGLLGWNCRNQLFGAEAGDVW